MKGWTSFRSTVTPAGICEVVAKTQDPRVSGRRGGWGFVSDRPSENGAVEADDVLGELRTEHEFVQPLLERLVELGNRTAAGESVEPKTMLIGVALLDAYLHRVHVSQEDRELMPEAEEVAMPACTVHLGDMKTNHSEMCDHAQRVIRDIRRWAAGEKSISFHVGKEVVELASKDYDAMQFEDTFALNCLQAELPETASQRLAARLAEHEGTRRALEGRIRRFLAGTYTT